MAPVLTSGRRDESGAGLSLRVPEPLDRARLVATLGVCRTLRHELATPISAAALHLEVARRAAGRADGASPGTVSTGVATALAKLEEASRLLDVLTFLGEARTGEPGVVDFGALAMGAAREVEPRLDALGLDLRGPAKTEETFVVGFGGELGAAVREALLAASRWAGRGEAVFRLDGPPDEASFSFRVPLGGESPGSRLFRPFSRPDAGVGPLAALWTFEAHGGLLLGSEENGFVTVTGSVPRVTP